MKLSPASSQHAGQCPFWTGLHTGRVIRRKSWWAWLLIVSGWTLIQGRFSGTATETLSYSSRGLSRFSRSFMGQL